MMGITLRKTLTHGPLRVNITKRGVGVSIGIKGARVSVGPTGTHVTLGGKGVYLRKKVNAKKLMAALLKPKGSTAPASTDSAIQQLTEAATPKSTRKKKSK